MRTTALFALLLAACVTRPPVARGLMLPRDTAQECANVCQQIGLQLSAVVVVASSAGCVCQVQPGAPPQGEGGASAATAGAIMVVEAEERQRKQQQESSQQQPSQPVYPPPYHH